jgi:beta-galactosidase
MVPMKRRTLLAAGAASSVAAVVLPRAASGAAPGQDEPLPRSIELPDGWRFVLANPRDITDPDGEYDGAPDPGYDDSDWREVPVPHDWSIELTPTDEDEYGTSGATGYLPGGLGWYRKGFTLPPQAEGKRINIEFDGVYMDSSVYCNGELVGNHPYGYTGFAFDITDHVHTDGETENVIAVRVQHKLPSSRWYPGSGIYRRVRLVITDPIHVQRWGTYVTTPGLAEEIGNGRATVRVETAVVNDSGDDAAVTVVSFVRDSEGRTVAETRSEVTVGHDPEYITQEVTVERPGLWSPQDPTLYHLDTELRVEGRTADAYRTRFGFRYFAIDPDTGLSLNGEHMKFQGVNLHHDLGALGAAVSRDALLRQLNLMRSMGVNAIRTSHNPPAPELIELCEELGFLMVVEAFDGWRSGKNPYDYGRFFDEWCDVDVAEMVGTARNSPSVVMWSIGNEIYDFTTEGLDMADRIIDGIRGLDATRPVIICSHHHREVPEEGSPEDVMLDKLDGLGVNYNTAASMDALHERYPDLFLFESESSSATSTRGTYQEPSQLNTGENHTPGRRATSSYDNNLSPWTMSGEYVLKKDRDRQYFAGQFLWTGIDYIGEPTPYDVFPVKSSFFGAVDIAGFPKDAYHLYRSQWTSEPMVHLVPMDWTTNEPGETVEVWAYSNVDSVELFLNGESLGVRRFDTKTTEDGRTYLETTEATGDDKTVTSGPYPGSYTSPNGSAGKLHLTWQVPFAAGELKAVARRDGETVATDVLRTADPAHALRLTPNRSKAAANGRSLIFVTVEAIDAGGVVVQDADHLVTFGVTGKGYLVGVDNGRQDSVERSQATTRTMFHGKALAIVRTSHQPGAITLTATASGAGLRPATITLQATAASPQATTPPPVLEPDPGPGDPASALADASYSGAPDTIPAAMLDGDPETGWSNAYYQEATNTLPAFDAARAADWVSVTWESERTIDRAEIDFTIDETHALPASLTASFWDGQRFVNCQDQSVDWATDSGAPTALTFREVTTGRLRLDMTSAHPGTSEGSQRITRLDIPDA